MHGLTKLISWFVNREARTCLALAMIVSLEARAQVIIYEGNTFPEALGWERISGGPFERRLEDGSLILSFTEPAQDFYRKDIGGISSLVDRYFIEWRAETDNPEWLIEEWQTPVAVASGGRTGVLYHTVMTESAVAFLRDISIPRVIVPISFDEPHTYRVEVFPNEYFWYIDGALMDNGIPEGPYPDEDASITWGARWNDIDSTTRYDFVRMGRIPDDASGDYDSDEAVMLIDHYFVVDCLTKDGPGIFGGPGENAGPGCRFADFDADADVDLLDFAEFQNSFGG